MNNPVNQLELTDTYIGHSIERQQNTQIFSSTHGNILYGIDPKTTVRPQNILKDLILQSISLTTMEKKPHQ